MCAALFWCTRCRTLLAPRTRPKEVDLRDFIEREEEYDRPMEDTDPSLALNPVVQARLLFEREAAAAKKKERDARAYRHGALKRLAASEYHTHPDYLRRQRDRSFYPPGTHMIPI